jgi:hypothetical protein
LKIKNVSEISQRCHTWQKTKNKRRLLIVKQNMKKREEVKSLLARSGLCL